jgi:hypothetical protein
LLAVAAGCGTTLGGLVGDRQGWAKTGVAALGLSALLVAGPAAPLASRLSAAPEATVLGALLNAMALPVAIKAVHLLMPQRPGLAFGIPWAAMVLVSAPSLVRLLLLARCCGFGGTPEDFQQVLLLDSSRSVLVAVVVSAALLAVGLALTARVLRRDLVDLTHRVRPRAQVSEARDGARVAVAGALHGEPGEPQVVAPFTDRPCLCCQTILEVQDARGTASRAEEILGVGWARIADDSGTARVRLFDDRASLDLRLSDRRDVVLSLVELEQVASWLERIGVSARDVDPGFPGVERLPGFPGRCGGERVLPAEYSIRQRVILDGERVLVAGACVRRPGPAGQGESYRAPPMEVVLEAPHDEEETPLLVVAEDRLRSIVTEEARRRPWRG